MTAVGRHALVGSNPTPGANELKPKVESVKDLGSFGMPPGGGREIVNRKRKIVHKAVFRQSDDSSKELFCVAGINYFRDFSERGPAS
jgi:hypothetical protein